MSGLEVAGVVLGSLPLVISALEHYADGINTAKRFWRYKSEMRLLILQMNTERGIFINTLEQMLTGIVRIDQMSDFFSNPGGDVWTKAGIESKLKDRLRSVFGIYLENVKGMAASLQKMKEKLALDPDGKPQFDDPFLFKQEFKRLKFCISKTEYAEQVGELKNYNQALIRLTKQSLELEPTRKTDRLSSCPKFSVVQSYARTLFETLKSGLKCRCDNHAVKLRLENRDGREETGQGPLTPFRIIFTHDIRGHISSTNPVGLWNWEEADVRCILDNVPKSVPIVCPPTGGAKPLPTRKVRFGQVQAQSNVQNATTTIVQQNSAIVSSAPDAINDLCKAMTQLQQPRLEKCIGYLTDSTNKKHGIYLLHTSTANKPRPWASYTLREVLTKRANITRRLTKHDKLRVAVSLASSVLQLWNTPWLQEHWSHDDVYFVQRSDVPQTNVYEHPFVYRKLSSTTSNQHNPAQPTASRVIRNPTLFALGILLIELLYGKTIHELQAPGDLNCQGTPGVAWCTAVRLIDEEIEFEAGPRYLDAVRRCIRCDFNHKEANLSDEAFQRAVFKGVVAPLEKTLQQFLSLD